MSIVLWALVIITLALLGHKIPVLSVFFLRPVNYPSQSRIEVPGVRLLRHGELDSSYHSYASSVNLRTGSINYIGITTYSLRASYFVEAINHNSSGEDRSYAFHFYDYKSKKNRERGIVESDWWITLPDIRHGLGKKESVMSYVHPTKLGYVYLDEVATLNSNNDVIRHQKNMDLRCWDEANYNISEASRKIAGIGRFFQNLILIAFYFFVATMAYVAWIAITK